MVSELRTSCSYGRAAAAAAATLCGLRVLPGGTGRELQGFYHAADDDAYQGSKAIPGLLHQGLGDEVNLSRPPKMKLYTAPDFLLCRLLKRLDFPSMTFTLYFMGYEKAEDIPSDETERTQWMFMRKATVELTQ